MKTIGVTGASGLLGWHLCSRLKTDATVRMLVIGRADLQSGSRLMDLLSQCDVLVHFAGMNRGEDSEVERVNVTLAEKLVRAAEDAKVRPHVIFSSSTHIDRDTAYGRSKAAVGGMFKEFSNRTGSRFTNLVLPHVFGEHGRPFSNSVVSTFCHQLARNEEPTIDRDSELNLLHAQEVADLVLEAIREERVGEIRPEGRRILVSDMLELVQRMETGYRAGIIPAFRDLFDLRLFNTLRSYLYPDFYPQRPALHTDPRGSLFEAVKSIHGGQAFLSTTRPGVTRGNHFHLNKVERFLVIRGEAVIRLRRVLHETIREFKVSGDDPVFIDMPTLHTHNITNTGTGELLTLFWSHEIFDPRSPDTYPEVVEIGKASE